jgi:hypothetical protein
MLKHNEQHYSTKKSSAGVGLLSGVAVFVLRDGLIYVVAWRHWIDVPALATLQ